MHWLAYNLFIEPSISTEFTSIKELTMNIHPFSRPVLSY
jgi:hypothetical protein